MNVYDFDDTIYDGDSTIDFYLFCMKNHPKVISYLPKQCLALLLYKLGKITKTEFKERFFAFLRVIDDIEKDVVLFWDKNQYKIKEWYINNQEKEDLVISASPRFLLSEVCKRKGIFRLIASEVDSKNGIFYNENCYGDMKVEFFLREYPQDKIDKFYTDSVSDLPLAKLASEAYLVDKEKVTRWDIDGERI